MRSGSCLSGILYLASLILAFDHCLASFHFFSVASLLR